MTTFLLIVIAVISYFLGGFNGSIISSKYIFQKDIRDYGSGNAGLTNFFRIFGIGGMALVVAVDVIKSVIAVLIGSLLLGIVGQPVIGKLFAGFCLALGHAYPAMYSLRGGKSVLCSAVLVFLVDWRVGIACVVVFVVAVAFTRFVSLGAVSASVVFPLGIWIFGYGWLAGFLALFVSLLVVFAHRANIMRLIAGNENKLELNLHPQSGRDSHP